MPIDVDSEIRVLAENEFHQAAHRVLGIAFAVHNEFGRLLDEDFYQQAIRRRCELAGVVPARHEVEIRVYHEDFQKSYFMDLLFERGLMVESKTVEVLNNAHYAQALHYLLLTGMRHGLLINLRPNKVDKRYVSTTLDLAARRRFVVHDTDWHAINRSGQRVRDLFLGLLADWGTFLQTSLYRDALIHFFGGPSVALQRIPVYDGDVAVANHEVCLIAEDTALALTALKDGKGQMLDHLQRFLAHTRLTAIQWINMDNHDIEFRTLQNRDGDGRMMGAE